MGSQAAGCESCAGTYGQRNSGGVVGLFYNQYCKAYKPPPPPKPVVKPEPVKPVEPVRPVEPIVPIKPIEPIQPIQPLEPIQPPGRNNF